jgi:hypothetical protein
MDENDERDKMNKAWNSNLKMALEESLKKKLVSILLIHLICFKEGIVAWKSFIYLVTFDTI